MTVVVVNLALLRIAEHAVRFSAHAKLDFRFGFIFRIAIGVIFQRALAVRSLDLFDARGPRHAEYFVIVSLTRLRHATSFSWCACDSLRFSIEICFGPASNSAAPVHTRQLTVFLDAGASFTATRTIAGRSTRPWNTYP